MGTIGAKVDEYFTSSTLPQGKGFGLGDKWEGPDGQVYKFVKYNNGTAVDAVVGNVCYYFEDDGYSLNIVTCDLSESSNIGAGVLMSAIPDLGYGWIKIRGSHVLTTALTAGADGNALTAVGATDGTLDVSAAVTDHICAIAEDASAKLIVCLFPD